MSTCLPPLSTEPGISEAVLRSAGVALETVVAHLQSVPRSSDAAMFSCGHAVPCGREQPGSSLSTPAAHLVSLCRQILQRLDAPFLEVPLLPQPICDSAGTNGNATAMLCVCGCDDSATVVWHFQTRSLRPRQEGRVGVHRHGERITAVHSAAGIGSPCSLSGQ